MEDFNKKDREDVHSISFRAGKRTYFFDIKETKSQEYYLTVTESKKLFPEGRAPYFEKHKIFLYREDFEKFIQAMQDAVEFIDTRQPVVEHHSKADYHNDIQFEDLDN